MPSATRLERFDAPLPPGFRLPPTPNLVGILTGGCGASWPFGQFWAHSHLRRIGLEPHGWICVREREWCFDPDDPTRTTPSKLLLHELAHIATDSEHTLAWAKHLVSIGGVIDPEYEALMMIRR